MSNNNGASLEQIVRPSTAPDIRPAYPIYIKTSNPEPSETPKVWGSSANSLFDLKAHEEASVKPATWPEEDRTFDEVKVFNKDDKETSVTVEVMTQYNGRNPKTQQKFTQNFNPPTDSDTSEVVSRGNRR